MTQSAGHTEYLLKLTDVNSARQLRVLMQLARKYGTEFRKVNREAKAAGRSVERMGHSGQGVFGRLGSQLGGIMASMASIQTAINLAQRELENLENRRAAALQTGLDVSAAQARAYRAAWPEIGLTPERVDEIVRDNMYYTGLGQLIGYRAMEAVGSAVSPDRRLSVEQIESAYRVGGRAATLAGEQESAAHYITGLQVLMRQLGIQDAREAQGLLLYGFRGARIESLADVAHVLPRAIAQQQAFGFNLPFSLAALNFLSSRGEDPTGQKTVTAIVQLERNLKEQSLYPFRRELRPDEPGYWVTRYGMKMRAPEKERYTTDYRGLPHAIDRWGGVDQRLDTAASSLEEFTRTAARGLQKMREPLGWIFGDTAIGGDWMLPLEGGLRKAQHFAMNAFRDPIGQWEYHIRQALIMTPEEQVEMQKKLLARAQMRGVLVQALTGEPSAVQDLRAMFAHAEAAVAEGNFARYSDRLEQLLMDSGGPKRLGAAAGDVVKQDLELLDEIHQREQISMNVMRGVREALGDKSWISQRIDEFTAQMEMIGSYLPESQDPLDRAMWKLYEWAGDTRYPHQAAALRRGARELDAIIEMAPPWKDVLQYQLNLRKDQMEPSAWRQFWRGLSSPPEGERVEDAFPMHMWNRARRALDSFPLLGAFYDEMVLNDEVEVTERKKASWWWPWKGTDRQMTPATQQEKTTKPRQPDEDTQSSAAPVGSRQIMLIDAAAQPFYPGATPLQRGFGYG